MKTHGFTLLEVVIALTIVGLVLGSLLAVSAGSKRLAFKSLGYMEQAVYLRAAVNAAQVLPEPEYPEAPLPYARDYRFSAAEELERPPRQTQDILYTLEAYHFIGNGAEMPGSKSLRWKKLESIKK